MRADHVTTVRRYDEAWADHDADSRLATLLEIWAEDGIYVDPDVADGVRGPHALSDFVAASFAAMPGLAVSATSEPAVLGDRAWYSWVQTTSDGKSLPGIDFIEFAPDGRIARLTGFYL